MLKQKLSECRELHGYQERFREADKERAVLQEKLNSSHSNSIVANACFALGALILGFLPTIWRINYWGYIAFGIAAALFAIGYQAQKGKR